MPDKLGNTIQEDQQELDTGDESMRNVILILGFLYDNRDITFQYKHDIQSRFDRNR